MTYSTSLWHQFVANTRIYICACVNFIFCFFKILLGRMQFKIRANMHTNDYLEMQPSIQLNSKYRPENNSLILLEIIQNVQIRDIMWINCEERITISCQFTWFPFKKNDQWWIQQKICAVLNGLENSKMIKTRKTNKK